MTPSRPKLGVNVDHVATLRQARGTRYPDPIEAARIAVTAGADQITIHLREDRRHIIDEDVFRMRSEVETRLNLEMAVTDEMVDIACEVKPDMVTLVPEKREERTTEGGLNCLNNSSLPNAVKRLTDAGCLVSLFIDPDVRQLDAAIALGVPMIELHTGDYADAEGEIRAVHAQSLRAGAVHAYDAGIIVAAGHGLHTRNVAQLVRIPQIVEYNIGHSIVARSVFVGFAAAVAEMIEALTPTP
ncbi:MAG: pyridoxine 5-phosphate synthase [Bradymonadia bacterium]|jgi:pyridoxine 5-phosphate synthase